MSLRKQRASVTKWKPRGPGLGRIPWWPDPREPAVRFLDWWIPLWQQFQGLELNQQASRDAYRAPKGQAARKGSSKRRNLDAAAGLDALTGDQRTPQQRYKRDFGKSD